MASAVYFHSLEQKAEHEFAPLDPRPGLASLVQRLGLAGAARGSAGWGLKVQLGGPGLPPAVDPGWAGAVATALGGSGQSGEESFCFDTLSITTGGLDRADTQLEMAQAKGYGSAGLRYLVADGPDQGDPVIPAAGDDHGLAGFTIAPLAASLSGLCALNPVRPHPHAGLQGALFNLGVGLADRAGKILLHQDIRPSVNTPLCAGCGSCLAVCLFDAIAITGGRAFIDHTKCTGCGECMNVCFMAGISADEAAGIPRFQRRVAQAAQAVIRTIGAGLSGRAGYFNILVRLDRHASGPTSRGCERLGDVGVLASTDPVALDQATWDLIVDRIGGPLSTWSGFRQEPGPLLEEAEKLGLGTRDYRLVIE